jgi:enoyl-CoA hydratase/carnithine racemase
MRDELARLWAATAADRAVRAVIITGSGDRYFSAGMDLKEANQDEDAIARRDRLQRSRDIELLAALPQPTIAAINGYALGGGFEMALACDIRMIAEHAQMGFPEVALGLVPAGGGTQRLPRLIGYSRAAELVLSGRRLGASDAVRWGIASQAVPAAELLPMAIHFAKDIAALPDVAVRSAKDLLRMSEHAPISKGIDAELDALLALMALARFDGRR